LPTRFIQTLYEKRKKMKQLIIILLIYLTSNCVIGHPGTGIVIGKNGKVYYVESLANRIMVINKEGNVEPFVTGINNPHQLIIDKNGYLYTADDNTGIVYKISPEGVKTQYYISDTNSIVVGKWGDPFTIDNEGNIICIDKEPREFCFIIKISPTGIIDTIAGGAWGYADGNGTNAKFSKMHYGSMSMDEYGNLYLTDGLSRLRKINTDGRVFTLAKGLEHPLVNSIDKKGNILVSEYYGDRLLKINPQGEIITLAELKHPTGSVMSNNGDIYILTVHGTWKVYKLRQGELILLTPKKFETLKQIMKQASPLTIILVLVIGIIIYLITRIFVKVIKSWLKI